MDITKYPPTFQPDAVPSQYGWHHPVTNELLVSVPGGVHVQSLIDDQIIKKQEEQQKVKSRGKRSK